MLWRSPRWEELTLWSLDLETGGLDPLRDAVLAVGMVPVRQGRVMVGEGWSSLVRPGAGELITEGSIRAHQLLPAEVERAPQAEEVLAEVDRRLREGVLLVHHASFDLPFLRRLYRRAGRRWPGPRVVDTVDLLLAMKRRDRFRDPEGTAPPVLNLAQARARLGLPAYQAHDALADAVAAAELFLVLARRLGARTLRELR
jgi:DNA polymerase-3 subunit epsilon